VNYFEVFDLPRRLAIDPDALERRFYALSRECHPDFHQTAPAADQARALEASARLNAAYRALRDPITRVEYLVRLEEGQDAVAGAPGRPPAPPTLLAEMFEIQEALAEAKAAGLTDDARATLSAERQRLAERYRREEDRLRGPLAEGWDRAGESERHAALAALKEALGTRAYLRTVIEDLNAALGEDEAFFVSNRRH
jgi:molecular chaperone HscB